MFSKKKKLFSNRYWKLLVYSLLLFSIFHLIRDILQIFHIDNIISVSLHTSRIWCNPICDYITIPPEVFIIVVSIIILLRRKFGLLAKALIFVFLLWTSAF